MLFAAPAAGQTSAGPAEYTVFVKGAPVGEEEVAVRTGPEGTRIISSGRTSSPVPIVYRHVEFRYAPDGTPEAFSLEGTVGGSEFELRTTFENGAAITTGLQNGQPVSVRQDVSPRALLLPNGIFGGFAALVPRLRDASPGDEFRLFLVPSAELTARLAGVRDERMQVGTDLFAVRRYELVLNDPSGNIVVNVTTAADGSLLRVNVPTQSVDVMRSDIAGVSARTEVYSNPGDQAVSIPAPGFNVGATITVPTAAGGASAAPPFPAVVLVPGQNAPDRDTVTRGVPAMAQLAGTLARAGFLVVRYDRRGSGQSGGRTESATISDHADDVRTVVRWVGSRKDVDRRRVAVVGHDDSAWVAMLAASREGRISALVTLSASASTGADTILEQQGRELRDVQGSDEDRAEAVDLQKRIHEAVLTGRGWDQLPPEIRKQADTPWFKSLLSFDPLRVIANVDAPVLIVHGESNDRIPFSHAERLEAAARTGDPESVEVVRAPGVTHHLTAAGDQSKPLALRSRDLDAGVGQSIAAWLSRTLPAKR